LLRRESITRLVSLGENGNSFRFEKTATPLIKSNTIPAKKVTARRRPGLADFAREFHPREPRRHSSSSGSELLQHERNHELVRRVVCPRARSSVLEKLVARMRQRFFGIFTEGSRPRQIAA
jgi:hypothetical protein